MGKATDPQATAPLEKTPCLVLARGHIAFLLPVRKCISSQSLPGISH